MPVGFRLVAVRVLVPARRRNRGVVLVIVVPVVVAVPMGVLDRSVVVFVFVALEAQEPDRRPHLCTGAPSTATLVDAGQGV